MDDYILEWKRRVTYKDSFKDYNVILHYILKLSL